MTQTAALTLDLNAFFSKARLLFTSTKSVFSELAQNGERAGATSVHFTFDAPTKTLTYRDDGSGLTDLAHLFDKGRSHWESPDVADQKPYGLGFLSCLANAEAFVVRSGESQMSGRTDDVLAGKPVEIVSCHPVAGVEVILSGLKAQITPDYFRGFTIPVYMNGEAVARPDALREDFITIPGVGKLGVSQLEAERGKALDLCRLPDLKALDVYLLGFRVRAQYSFLNRSAHATAALHISPQEFEAVMPDRARLTEESEKKLTAAYDAWRISTMREHLTAVPREVANTPDWVSRHVGSLHECGIISKLNDLDYLPGGWLAPVNGDSMNCGGYHNWSLFGHDTRLAAMSREQLEASDRLLVSTRDVEVSYVDSEELRMFSVARTQYAQAHEALLFDEKYDLRLDSDHWIWKRIDRVNEGSLRLQVEALDLPEALLPTAGWGDHPVIPVASITMDGPFGGVDIKEPIVALRGADGAFMPVKDEDDEAEGREPHELLCILMPVSANAIVDRYSAVAVLELVENFLDENESYNESYANTRGEELANQLNTVLLSAQGAEAVLANLLKEHRHLLKHFSGATVALSINDEGGIQAA